MKLCGRVSITVQPAEGIKEFACIQGIFAVPVARFYIGHRGITTFENKLHLSAVCWAAVHLFGCFFEKITRRGEFYCRVSGCFIKLVDHVNIGAGWAAAMVANSRGT